MHTSCGPESAAGPSVVHIIRRPWRGNCRRRRSDRETRNYITSGPAAAGPVGIQQAIELDKHQPPLLLASAARTIRKKTKSKERKHGSDKIITRRLCYVECTQYSIRPKRSAIRNRSFRGQTRVLNANGISIPSSVFAGKEKGKEEYLYSAFYILCISQSAQAWITQFYLQIHHACLSFVSVHQMAPPLTEVRDI